MRKFTPLQTLYLGAISGDDHFQKSELRDYFVQRLRSMKKIDLSSDNISDGMIEQIYMLAGHLLTSLEEVDVSKNMLDLHGAIWELCHRIPSVKALHMRGCENIHTAYSLSHSSYNLEVLDILHYESVGFYDILDCVERCPNLKVLRLPRLNRGMKVRHRFYNIVNKLDNLNILEVEICRSKPSSGQQDAPVIDRMKRIETIISSDALLLTRTITPPPVYITSETLWMGSKLAEAESRFHPSELRTRHVRGIDISQVYFHNTFLETGNVRLNECILPNLRILYVKMHREPFLPDASNLRCLYFNRAVGDELTPEDVERIKGYRRLREIGFLKVCFSTKAKEQILKIVETSPTIRIFRCSRTDDKCESSYTSRVVRYGTLQDMVRQTIFAYRLDCSALPPVIRLKDGWGIY